MVQILAKPITLTEFLAKPETKSASEFIGGQIITKPMRQGRHSTIQGELLRAINDVVKPSRTAWAFPELRCTFADRSIVPDIAVFQWQRIPTNNDGTVADKILIAPDWTIEILSPDQSSSRVTRNILSCLSHGTEMGWLIDPSEQIVFAHTAQQPTQCLENTNDFIPVPSFAQELQLTLGEIFGWLRVN
jgi:Uma2 family endonuclease